MPTVTDVEEKYIIVSDDPDEAITIEDAPIQEIRLGLDVEQVVTVIEGASPGPQGRQGPQGPTGPSASVDSYTHNQITPSDTWTIVHNLGKFPAVTVVDSAGSTVEGDIFYSGPNQVIVSFGAAFGGKAYLN